MLNDFTLEEIKVIVADCCSMCELCKKLGYYSSGNNSKTIKKFLVANNISIEHFTGKPKGIIARTPENVFIENSTADQQTVRRYYYKGNYSEYKCAICGLEPVWNNKPLVLTLDHINGKNHDDRIENLRWVCPNCDRQLPTFGFKNGHKSQNINFIADEKLIKEKNNKVKNNVKKENELAIPEFDILKQQLWELKSFSAVARLYNTSATTIRRWCKKLNLPCTIDIIKMTTEEGWQNNNFGDKPVIYMSPTQPKAVKQLDINTNEIIATFSSCVQAGFALKQDKNKARKVAIHIGHCCKGMRYTAYGYKWQYVDDNN